MSWESWASFLDDDITIGNPLSKEMQTNINKDMVQNCFITVMKNLIIIIMCYMRILMVMVHTWS